MKLLRRPLALACICFIACAVLGFFYPSFSGELALISAVLSCVLLLLFILLQKRAKKVVFTCFLCALFCFLSAFSSHLYFKDKMSRVENVYGCEVRVEGYVTQTLSRRSYGGIYHITAEKIDGEKTKANLILETDSAVLSEDDEFSATVIMEPFEENIGGYAERMISMSEGFLCRCVQSGEYSITGKREKDMVSYIYNVREWTGKRFDSILDSRTAGLFTAAFAGDDSYVSDRDMLALRRSGTTHILAVSGTHFTVIMTAVMLFLTPIGLPIKARNTILCAIAFLYMAFTGFSPSVVRSALMLSLTYLGGFLGKARDMTTSLLLTMALMIGASPYLIINAAFWLSSGATLGIILCLPVLEELFGFEHKLVLSDILRDTELPVLSRVLKYIKAIALAWVKGLPAYALTTVIVSLFASALAIPISLVFFGNISLAAIVSGFIMSPIASAIIVAAPFVLVLGKIPAVAFLCRAASEFFFGTAHFFSDIDGIYININYTSVKILSLVFFAAVLLVVLFSHKQRILIPIFAIFVLSAVGASYISERVEYGGVDVVSVSADDANLMCVRSERGLVIADMGTRSRSDVNAGLAAAADLRENTVSAYIITDLKQKHISLVEYLCSNFHVKTVYLPQYVTEDKAILAKAAERVALSCGSDVEYFEFGESFAADETDVCVSELEYISRSTLPLYAVSMKRAGRETVWCSQSYFDRSDTDFVYNRFPDAFVFGTYGAKIKTENGALLGMLGAEHYHVPSGELYSSFSEDKISVMQEHGLFTDATVSWKFEKTE